MSRPLRIEAEPNNFIVQVQGPITGLSKATGADQSLENRMLRLANTLQSSLDVPRILEIFHGEILPVVPHDSLGYRHPEEGLEVAIGRRDRHSCSYQIILADRPEGEVTFTRKNRFTQAETQQLETLLCALAYPLHNAVLYKRAIEAAFKDPVTGIGNRAAMDSALHREVELSHRHHTDLSLIILDIDKFKGINDTYGHLAGDILLRGLARCLQANVRGSDMAFRYGGEEFVLVLSNTGLAGAQLLAERVRAAVERQEFRLENRPVKITVSLGVALLRREDDMQSFLDRADRMLYQAKALGRNRVLTEVCTDA